MIEIEACGEYCYCKHTKNKDEEGKFFKKGQIGLVYRRWSWWVFVTDVGVERRNWRFLQDFWVTGEWWEGCFKKKTTNCGKICFRGKTWSVWIQEFVVLQVHWMEMRIDCCTLEYGAQERGLCQTLVIRAGRWHDAGENVVVGEGPSGQCGHMRMTLRVKLAFFKAVLTNRVWEKTHSLQLHHHTLSASRALLSECESRPVVGRLPVKS